MKKMVFVLLTIVGVVQLQAQKVLKLEDCR